MNLNDISDAAMAIGRDMLAAIGPAMAGSGVGQAWSTGLTWRQRTIQWLTGILVSYYVTKGVTEVFGLGPFMGQAIGFVIAMMAFEVAPKIIAAASATAARIPEFVADFVARWTGAAPKTPIEKGPEE